MSERLLFWTISFAIVVVLLGVGFWIVPNWVHTFQTPEQRYDYLIRSIWCPI